MNLYKTILSHPNEIDEIVSKQDVTNPTVRQQVIEALQALLVEHIHPALPDETERSEEKTTGELHGMVLGAFCQQFTSLDEPPTAAQIRDYADDLGLNSSLSGEEILSAWRYETALVLMRKLLPLLLVALPRDRAHTIWEIEHIEEMTDGPLPGFERTMLDTILGKLKANITDLSL